MRLLLAVLVVGGLTTQLAASPLPISKPRQTTQTESSQPFLANSSTLYAQDGSVLTMLHGEVDREIVPLRDLPATLPHAVVAIEDGRFWHHGAIDPTSLMRAFLANARAMVFRTGQIQGGSTITQQLAKNVYLQDRSRTFGRKIAEVSVAVQLERSHTKRQILETYLNAVYLGRGAYGMKAAARTYFGKDVKDISLAESALLAGLIHNPSRYDYTAMSGNRKTVAMSALRARRNTVLHRMLDLGLVRRWQYDLAVKEPIGLMPPTEQNWPHPYFVDGVLRELGVLRGRGLDERYSMLGTTRRSRADRVYGGGLRIYTTLDPRAQDAAEHAVADILPDNIDKLSAALVAVDPESGGVRAAVGGLDYYKSGSPNARVNLALGADGGGSGRQPGSSFKPIVLASALEHGVKLRRTFDSSPFQAKFHGQTWKVSNYEGNGHGYIDLVDATVHSVNAAYAHLLIEGVGDGDPLAGADRVAATARRLGVPFPTADELKGKCGPKFMKVDACVPASTVPGIALGAKEVSPLTMAGVYATFASGGRLARPTFIQRIEDRSGKVLYSSEPKPDQAITKSIASAIANVLSQVVKSGTGVRAQLDRPVAGKTGTSQEWRDAWFDGFTPQLAASVWVGNPAGQESMIPRNGYPLKVVGGTYPAMIWRQFMAAAMQGVPVQGFPEAPQELFGTDTRPMGPEMPSASIMPFDMPGFPFTRSDFPTFRGYDRQRAQREPMRTPRPPRTPPPYYRP